MGSFKKGICTLKLKNLKKVYNEDGEIDESLLRATFIILDFNISENNQLVPKELALKGAYTLKYKPLLCQYKETTNNDEFNDNFGTHGEYVGKLRNGDEYILTNTHAIGVCEDKGYLGVVKDENGKDEDVLMADFVLWALRYPNEISLINDFYDKGEDLYSSCEYFYTSSKKKEDSKKKKYEEITSDILFDGHCCLGKEISPAYSSSKLISFNSKWNKSLNQKMLKNKNNKEENSMENVFLKSLNGISFGKTRSKIYKELSKVMVASEYEYVYLSDYDIYDDYFVYETRINEEWVTFKIPYSKTEEGIVTIEYDKKSKAEFKTEWVSVSEANDTKKSLNEAKIEIGQLKTEKNKKVEEIKSLNSKLKGKVESPKKIKEDESKSDNTKKIKELRENLNTATEKLTSLNSKIKEMQPIVEKQNKEEYEKSLNETKEKYEEKFSKVNALDKFKSDEVQNLIKESLNTKEDIKGKAIASLNSMVVDSINISKNEEKDKLIKESCSKQTNLIPTTNDSFEARYGL